MAIRGWEDLILFFNGHVGDERSEGERPLHPVFVLSPMRRGLLPIWLSLACRIGDVCRTFSSEWVCCDSDSIDWAKGGW